jgi:hypothetical protein
VEFRRVQGEADFEVAFRIDWEREVLGHPGRACAFGMNRWNNSAHTLEGWVNDGKGWRAYAPGVKPAPPADTWAQARVSVRGDHAQCFLGGQKLFDSPIDKRNATGCVGLMTWLGSYRFRNIKVTDPAGKVLLEGLPDLDPAWAAK